MALKFEYERKEEIPAEHVGLYAEREGAWFLYVDGVADKTKLDEFRQSNVALLEQLDKQKRRFERGRVEFSLTGSRGGAYQIASSFDRVHWEIAKTLVFTNSTVVVSDTDMVANYRFYRARKID